MATIAKASNMAKKAKSSTTAGASRISSNRGSRENKCGDGMSYLEDRIGIV